MSDDRRDRPLCIYCERRPAVTGDHLLPAALGRYQFAGTDKCVMCGREGSTKGCNEELTGYLCDRLFRRGPYSLHRRAHAYAVGRTSRTGARSSGYSYDLPSAEFEGWDVPIRMEMEQGRTEGREARQLQLRDRQGRAQAWLVPPDVKSAEDLGRALGRAGKLDCVPDRFIDAEGGDLLELLNAVFPHLRGELTATTLSCRVVKVSKTWAIEPVHARAITMLGFHLFLLFANARGDEPGFREVREVVHGDRDPWEVTCNVLRKDPDKPVLAMTDESPGVAKHVVLVGADQPGELRVMLRLFAERTEEESPWWRVRLVQRMSGVAKPGGFGLVCFAGGPKDVDGRTLDGRVCALRAIDGGFAVPAV